MTPSNIIINRIKISHSYNKILSIIKSNRLIVDRRREIGFDNVEIKPMGSGGIGQIKSFNNEVYVQIGYGKGKYNYAYAVKIGKIVKYRGEEIYVPYRLI